MALRKIVFLDNPVLRKRAIKVTSFDAGFQKLVDDMLETLIDAPGVGLAAPQVNISQRVIIVRLPDDEDSRAEYGDQAGVVYALANPEIVKASKTMVDGVEACLSIPGWFGSVDRHESVLVKGLDRHGQPVRVKAKGWLARVFQHEIDHLNGQLYIDIASEVWKAKDGEDGEETLSEAEQHAGQNAD